MIERDAMLFILFLGVGCGVILGYIIGDKLSRHRTCMCCGEQREMYACQECVSWINEESDHDTSA